jgi:hypothetical protein
MRKPGPESRVVGSAHDEVARALCRILERRTPGVLSVPGIPEANEKAPGGAASSPQDLWGLTAPADVEPLAERLRYGVAASDEQRDLANALGWASIFEIPRA